MTKACKPHLPVPLILEPPPNAAGLRAPLSSVLRETTTQAIRRFPRRVACDIENGNVDGCELLYRVLMRLVLIWISDVVALEDSEAKEVRWYVSHAEPREWQTGS